MGFDGLIGPQVEAILAQCRGEKLALVIAAW
jgi:hypothetical protein